jgi:hypothetical protein
MTSREFWICGLQNLQSFVIHKISSFPWPFGLILCSLWQKLTILKCSTVESGGANRLSSPWGAASSLWANFTPWGQSSPLGGGARLNASFKSVRFPAQPINANYKKRKESKWLATYRHNFFTRKKILHM